MRGCVLGHDAAADATVLSGEDGQRYRFSYFEWREATPPRKGEVVDFEPDGRRARDVFRVVATNAASRPAEAVDETPAEVLLRQQFVRFVLARPVLVASILILLACLVGAYAIDGARMSLIAAPELAWRMSMAIDGLLAGSGPDPGPRLAGAIAKVATAFLLLLYVVPALAAFVAWREFVGRPEPRAAWLAGVVAMVLPLALPVLVVLIVRAGVLPGLSEVSVRLGRAGLSTPAHVFHPFELFASGCFLVMIGGFVLWAAATERLSRWIAAAAPPPTVSSASAAEPDEPHGQFAPLVSPERTAPAEQRGPAAGRAIGAGPEVAYNGSNSPLKAAMLASDSSLRAEGIRDSVQSHSRAPRQPSAREPWSREMLVSPPKAPRQPGVEPVRPVPEPAPAAGSWPEPDSHWQRRHEALSGAPSSPRPSGRSRAVGETL